MNEIYRNSTCNICVHAVSMRHMEVFCDITETYVPDRTAFKCKDYKAFNPKERVTINGYMVKNLQSEDYRTEKQWAKSGYKLKTKAIGTLMYSCKRAAEIDKNNLTRYYTKNEVERI